MMLEKCLKLFSFFKKLRDSKIKRDQRYFVNYVQPAMNASEVVMQDFLTLLQEVKRQCEKGKTPEELIRFLEDSRVKYLPIRMKLRNQAMTQPTYRKNFTKFEKGIINLLQGGMRTFDDYVNINNSNVVEHTILNVIYKLNNEKLVKEKSLIIDIIDNQIDLIKKSFNDIVSGFSEIQAKIIKG